MAGKDLQCIRSALRNISLLLLLLLLLVVVVVVVVVVIYSLKQI